MATQKAKTALEESPKYENVRRLFKEVDRSIDGMENITLGLDNMIKAINYELEAL